MSYIFLISEILQVKIQWKEDVEVEIKEDERTNAEGSNIIDPYDIIYSNIPDNAHVLKPEENY